MPTPLIDMTGQQFGEWTVLRRATTLRPSKNVHWLCRCSCGNEREVSGGNLRSGKTSRCSSCRKARLSTDATGKRYGRWTVKAEAPADGSRNRRVVALCDCGNEWIVYLSHLVTGRSRQCRRCGHTASRI
jgi:hypothetical protein